MNDLLTHLVASVLSLLTLTFGAQGPHATPAHDYVWPLAPKPAVVRGFDPPPQPWAAGHRGVDLLGRVDQAVRAAGAGTISFSGVIAGVGIVTVTHPNGWHTTYEPISHRAKKGTEVAAGTRIGVLTSKGSHCAPRTCLHWGLLVAPDEYRDPLTLLVRRKPILLPLG